MKPRKFLFLFGVSFVFLFFFGSFSTIFAAYDSPENILDFEERVFGTTNYNVESHGYSNVNNISNSLTSMIIGCFSDTCKEQRKFSDAGGALGQINGLIASFYLNPPASGGYYLVDLGQRLNIVSPAYAQGIGFSGLTPILPLWRAFRNIAYTFFVLIFILIGFAMIFRVKISPQAIVTIQSAIPKAVMALILVTFSYAIAGLVIDLMYLLIGLFFAVIPASFKNSLPHGNDLSYYYSGGFGEILHNVWDVGWGSLQHFGKITYVGAGGGLAIGGVIAGIIGGFTLPILGLGVIAGAGVLALIVSTLLLLVSARIFWTLLVAYINILLSILVAPIQLMFSAIPGQNTFDSWLKNILKNVLVFPTVVAMFILAFIFSKLPEISGGSLWVPPLLGFGGEEAGRIIGPIIGFGIIILTPNAANIVKSLFEKKPFDYGGALGEPIRSAGGVVIKAGKAGWGKTPWVKEREIEKETKAKEEVESRLRQRHPDWYQKG